MGASNRNIVVICLDSVRKDVFDEMAPRTVEQCSVMLDQCRAASSWSTPSHASIISGKLPHEHGVHTHSKSFHSLPKEDTIFDELEAYRTIGISANLFAGPSFGFDEYFDEFVEVHKKRRRHPEGLAPYQYVLGDESKASAYLRYLKESLFHTNSIKSLHNGIIALLYFTLPGEKIQRLYEGFTSRIFDYGARGMLEIASRELETGDEPTFIFMNLMEGHLPHRPTRYLDSDLYDCPRNWSSEKKDVWQLIEEEYDEQYWEWRNRLYRANIDYLDRCISNFIDGLPENTSVVVTADHGENLGTPVDEHLVNHTSSLSEGVLHVPLLIHDPPEEFEEFDDRFFSHLQLPELLLGLRDETVPDLSTDRTYAEVVGLSPGPKPLENADFWNRMIRAAYRDSEKIIWDSRGNVDRYRLDRSKPNWQEKTAEPESVPDWATQAFPESIEAYKESARTANEEVEVDEATKEQLRELGYA